MMPVEYCEKRVKQYQQPKYGKNVMLHIATFAGVVILTSIINFPFN